MHRIGHGEAVVMHRSSADGWPLHFTWRNTRYQVSRLESVAKSRRKDSQDGRNLCRTFRVTTSSGFRCTLSQHGQDEIWQMERVLNGKGG